MKRGVSSLGWPEAGLDDLLALARSYDLNAVELRSLGGTLDLPRWFAAKYGNPAALRAAAGAFGVDIPVLGTSFRLTRPDPLERESLLGFVPWAAALGARWIRVFDGDLHDEADYAVALETLHWWQAERELLGCRVNLAVETHDSLFTSAAISRFLRAAPGTPILWDSHHTWRRGGEDPLATWRAHAAHIVHIHVKDSVSIPGPRHPYTYVLPGTGEFPMSTLVSAIDSQSGSTLSLEWEKQWYPELPPLTAALDSARNHGWW